MSGAVGHRSIFRAGVEVSTYVAAGDSGISDQSDHDVGKILAYALPRLKGVFNRRIDSSTFLHIFKAAVDSGSDVPEERQGASPFPFVGSDLAGQLRKLRR